MSRIGSGSRVTPSSPVRRPRRPAAVERDPADGQVERQDEQPAAPPETDADGGVVPGPPHSRGEGIDRYA